MNDTTPVVERLADARVLAILRHRPNLVDDATKLVDAGVSVLECTLNSAGAIEAIATLRERYDGRVMVGAGTVVSPAEVDAVAAAGGEFIVSPNVDVEVIAAANERGLPALAGCATATEALTALGAGAAGLKLFPAGPLGKEYFRALLGPITAPAWVPTGGLALDDVQGWLDAGATCVGMGSAVMADLDRLGAFLHESR